jgi:dipeptidase
VIQFFPKEQALKNTSAEVIIMACTTILVGKNASFDGSTMIARDDDSPAGKFEPKKFTVVNPADQPAVYRSVLSRAEIALPPAPMRYTAVPNALSGEGIWAAAGANEKNVAMTATETITSNERVAGADPLAAYRPASGDTPESAGGIGEEDIVTLVLPYIRSAREGVVRLGGLIEKYGTYESNGIAFQDVNEIWWLESVGGHHWIAKRVPDDSYVVMPNQLGIDSFDLTDALGDGREHLCAPDTASFISKNHLAIPDNGKFNPREAFGSRTDADHVYNTPRAWFMERYLNPHAFRWDGPGADFSPDSDDIPWSGVPERRITVEDIKYLLSSHYQGTPYDPYSAYGDPSRRGMFRPIGINRNDFLGLFQIRPYVPEEFRTVEWLAFASNVFSALVPFYTGVGSVPEYLSNTGENASTDNFYWSSRIIAALADAHYGKCLPHIERYQFSVMSRGHGLIAGYDAQLAAAAPSGRSALCERANAEIAGMLRSETQDVLGKVLCEASSLMKNAYSRSDS